MSQRLDRELSMSQKIGLRLHLMLCAGCRNYGRQMDFLRQVSRKFPQRED
ncbi:MAG: zf-HC2 domain-containing protein [Burkholderiales bacterium]